MGQWEKDWEGNISVVPFVDYETAMVGNDSCAMRIEYVPSPDRIGKPPKALQLQLTPAQALELSEALTRTVTALKARAS